jgi:thiol-disulfide isomerase/thioredoxin
MGLLTFFRGRLIDFSVFLSMIKRIIPAFAFLAICSTAAAQKTNANLVIPKWKIEDVVRSFSAKNDTVYIVSFWATFCKPCNEEIPDFIRIADKYKGQKVKLMLVSLDLPSYVAVKLPAFIKKNNYKTNHVWLNETNADRFCPMIDPKWSGAIPATIIVNNNTGYRKFFEDQVKPEAFEATIKEAMAPKAMNRYAAPMKLATVEEKMTSSTEAPMQQYLSFRSNDSSVYSITGGKVSLVARIDQMKVVIIQEGGLFYTYSNLGSTPLKKGDEVKADQLLGYAALDMDGKSPTLELYISDADKGLKPKRTDFITRSK